MRFDRLFSVSVLMLAIALLARAGDDFKADADKARDAQEAAVIAVYPSRKASRDAVAFADKWINDYATWFQANKGKMTQEHAENFELTLWGCISKHGISMPYNTLGDTIWDSGVDLVVEAKDLYNEGKYKEAATKYAQAQQEFESSETPYKNTVEVGYAEPFPDMMIYLKILQSLYSE